MALSLSCVRSIPAPVLRELSGLTGDQFARLLAEVGPAWETDRFDRLERPGRQRVQGAGRKNALSFAARVLVVLIYLRWNISYRALGGLFGVSKDTVLRTMDEVLPLLAAVGITARDGDRIGNEADLTAELDKLAQGEPERAALVDGTFVPVNRPGGTFEDQRPMYNAHKHRHARNFQAVTDDLGRLLWVGGAGPGATHDLTALAGSTAAGALAASGVTVMGDKAYQGIAAKLGLTKAFTPKRRRRKDRPAPPPVTEAEAEFNTELARQRVHVEHAMRTLKIRRILHRYRLHPDRFNQVIRACANLATYPT